MDEIALERRNAIPALGFYPQEPVSTGTTLIAMEYDGGVVVGTDSRTSSGTYIASRVTNKINPITKYMAVCRSGSSADTQAIADIVKYYVEANSLLENEPLTIYRSAQIFRQFLYNYREQLSASVLVAGWDEKEGGQLYAIPIGGLTTRQRSTASGSGATYVSVILSLSRRLKYIARPSHCYIHAGEDQSFYLRGPDEMNEGFLDKMWKPNMSRDECVSVVREAVSLAVARDGSSGGVIRIGVVDSTGTEITLHRPDKNGFPVVTFPPSHQTYTSQVVAEAAQQA